MSKAKSGIAGYVYTATSITIKFTTGVAYRYDVSKALSKDQLLQMIRHAEAGSGLNSFINKNKDIKKYAYIDDTLRNASFHTYG